MGALILSGGNVQSLPGLLVYDVTPVGVSNIGGTINNLAFGAPQTLNIMRSILSNAILRGLTEGEQGMFRTFMISDTAVAGYTVQFNHNDGVATAGNRFFNSNSLANFILGVNGSITYYYGPLRNLGLFWQSVFLA